ncbi:hypothetical protein [Sulfurovum sp.]|uniref:hypothetical protein n=1 Tax=Sulfurovum sp. TaxID=1969726 RepID=UPI0035658586
MDKVKNTKLLTYDIKVRKVVSNKVRWYSFTDTESVGCIIYNLLACIRKGSVLLYSRNKNYTSGVSKKGMTPYRIIKAVDFLEKEGYIINHKGKASMVVENRRMSWVEPTDRFLSEWQVSEIYMQAELDYLDQCEVIELRDTNKNTIPYRNSEHISRMAEVVRSLNKMNEVCVVKDGNDKLLSNIYCRIFNESFDYGGRFYRADVLAIKNKDDNARLDITMDGSSVCEVDYSNLHFRIAAALEDLDSEDIPLDVYSGILDDETNKVDRGIVKLAVNMMFNCYNDEKAQGAIQKEINLLPKEEKSKYTLGNAKSVMALIYRAYPTFSHLFCEESSFGRILQNADSHLASDILEVMLENGIPCLPVHDSFVVKMEHMDLLCDTMGDCFRKRFETNGVVPVGVKWKINGLVNEEKICV